MTCVPLLTTSLNSPDVTSRLNWISNFPVVGWSVTGGTSFSGSSSALKVSPALATDAERES